MKSLLACICAVVLAACTAQTRTNDPANSPPSIQQAAVRTYSQDELVSLASTSTDSPVKSCVDVALRYNEGLMALRLAKTPPDKVHEYMMHGAEDAHLKEQKEREFSLWASHAELGSIDQSHFDYCLSIQHAATQSQALERTCFSMMGPAALAHLHRKAGIATTATLPREVEAYGRQLDKAYLAGIVDQVYAFTSEDDQYRFQQGLFAGCLKQVGRGSAGNGAAGS